MFTTDLTLLKITPDRIRKHFDEAAILDLARSIDEVGLMHPLVTRVADDGIYLIAGERRLRAIAHLASLGKSIWFDNTELPLGHVPCVTMGELDSLTALVVELEENVVRKDVSWQERVLAEERLHSLRLSLNPEHTVHDTAAIIYGDKPTAVETHVTKRNIIVAAHLNDPDVAGAKNEREAAQIARRKMEAMLVDELAARSPLTSSAHSLHHANALSFLPTIPPSSIDCIITDPPYGINANTLPPQSAQIDSVLHTYEDTPEIAAALVEAIAYADCMKPDSHIWMFCDARHFNQWADAFTVAGWYVWPHPIIWSKGGVGSLLGHANGPRHCYESILFAQRGFKRFKEVVPDVIEKIRADTSKLHAAQKPVELYSYLMRLSCDPGDVVLDPCCGSGTIFPAASANRCVAIGIEVDEHTHNLARTRMGEQ